MLPRTKNKNNTQYKKMSVLIARDGLSYFMETVQGELLHEHFHHSYTPEPETLLEKVKTTTDVVLGDQSPDHISICYDNDLYTLVPSAVYEQELAGDFLKHNIQLVHNDLISTDLISGPEDKHCVYIAYSNINNFFFERFGSFEYHHLTSKLVGRLEGRFKQEDSLEEDKKEYQQITLVLNSKIGHLQLSSDGKLKCQNSFLHDNEYDVLYYVMFTAAQFGFDPERFKLVLVQSAENEQLYPLLHTYVRHIAEKDYLEFLQPIICAS